MLFAVVFAPTPIQVRIEEQNEQLQLLETKLTASRDYSTKLETFLTKLTGTPVVPDADTMKPNDSAQVRNSTDTVHSASHSSTTQLMLTETFPLTTCLAPLPNGMSALELHDAMINSHENRMLQAVRPLGPDDRLLQETIRTFHQLLDERDQELVQLKQQNDLRADEENGCAETADTGKSVPLSTSIEVQTELDMWEANRLGDLSDTLTDGGMLISRDQLAALNDELLQSSIALDVDTVQKMKRSSSGTICFAGLLSMTTQLRQQAESLRLQQTLPAITEKQMKNGIEKWVIFLVNVNI